MTIMFRDEIIIEKCKKYTMTSDARLQQTLDSIEHVIKNGIEGDIVEVGVWRGGTVMAMLAKLQQLDVTDRQVHLYDTFKGMTESGPKDINPDGLVAKKLIEDVPFLNCEASLETVTWNLSMTGYPMDNIHIHVGDIRKVDMSTIPEKIACLRLNIDWHELYKFCLPVFEPLVQPNGVVTIDDYGYWSGCKEAVDDYLKGSKEPTKIDGEGVYWYK
jgi:O-methyltransferase